MPVDKTGARPGKRDGVSTASETPTTQTTMTALAHFSKKLLKVTICSSYKTV